MTDAHIAIIASVATALVVAVAARHYYVWKLNKRLSYMLDAFEDKETNFRFSEAKGFMRHFNRTLNRIRVLYDNERREIADREEYYGIMLEQVRTGIVVTETNERTEGRVVYSNSAARNLLGVATLSNIRQLKIIDDELETAFRTVTDVREQRASFYNERGKVVVMLSASFATLQGEPVKIVVMNDVTGDVAHSEVVSWNKLIRVLTHEIMNTVTPIASLSRTLSDEVANASPGNPPKLDELRQGLDTISESSGGLIKFVEAYRKLSRVAEPVKKPFFIRELIDKVQHLVDDEAQAAGVRISYIEKSDDILLYADENQLSQVVVNLIKNAIQAGADRVEITAEIDYAETIIVTVSNNGHPISRQSRDEIFVPFYTTKPEGTGIGLSLSRQIMRLHNGTIELKRSDNKLTTFVLHFR